MPMPHLAFVVLALSTIADPTSSAQDQPPKPDVPSPIEVVTALESALGDAIARAEPSVVAIAREKDGRGEQTTAVRGRMAPPTIPQEPPVGIGGFVMNLDDQESPDYIASDYGSGVVVGSKGEILTTFHVVKGASKLMVRAFGGKVFEAEILAADPRSDLAVIVPREIPGRPRPTLKPIALGDGTKLRKGMFLVALGNPFNAGRDGKASASWGILANLARRLDPAQVSPELRQLRHYPTMLQLDSKLNLGMAGGAVINLKGEMVGLTTNAANVGGFDSQAGYALPIDTLTRRAIEALKQGKEVEYGFLGVILHTSANTNLIKGVVRGTPAGEGGLMPNDEILSIGGLPVVDSDSLVMSVNAFTPGVPVAVRVRREGIEIEKTVTLSKLPMSGEIIATNRPATWRGLRVDFVSTNPKVVYGEEILKAMAQGGVLVVEIQPGSAADDAGFKVGQIIVKVEGQPVKNPADFAAAVEGLRGTVTLTTEGERNLPVR
jgi:serine protease Do